MKEYFRQCWYVVGVRCHVPDCAHDTVSGHALTTEACSEKLLGRFIHVYFFSPSSRFMKLVLRPYIMLKWITKCSPLNVLYSILYSN